MKRAILFFSVILYAGLAMAQPLRLSHVFSDHMVLQRETDVKIWGWGKPGETVRVVGTWPQAAATTLVDAEGNWCLSLPTRVGDWHPLFSEGVNYGPYKMTVRSGGDIITVSDIMLGEVWICAGQSNMEMPLRGYGYQGVEGSTDAILDAMETAGDVRVLRVKTDKARKRVDDIETVWALSTPDVAAETSAVGYLFAKRLTKTLGCPVGIIVNAWGGSRIEPWMTVDEINSAGLNEKQLGEIYAVEEKEDCWPETPELIWNGRMAPLVGYGIRGFLWYQGCSNIDQCDCYNLLQNAMVDYWRRMWGCGNLPFIYTLLAPYSHGDADGRWRPFFVENQMKTAEEIPNAWYVSTETLGDKETIHPAKKKEVADMMVLRALQNVYGMNLGINIEVPRLQSVEWQEDGSARLRLTEINSNLGSVSARQVVGFELAGEDRVFHPAEAEVQRDGETVIVRCAEVPHPVAVRYSWRNWMGATLAKVSGIPVPPLRSDDWDY